MNILHVFTYLWSLPYVRWHMVFTIPVTLILWLVWGKYLLRYKKTFFAIFIGSLIWGIPFDYLATPVFHIYYFTPVNLGISFLGLPLEEYLFIVFVPLAVTAIILIVRGYMYGKIRV